MTTYRGPFLADRGLLLGRLLFFRWIWLRSPTPTGWQGHTHRLKQVPPGCRLLDPPPPPRCDRYQPRGEEEGGGGLGDGPNQKVPNAWPRDLYSTLRVVQTQRAFTWQVTSN